MRHRRKKKVLGRGKSHRKLLIKNLIKSFFIGEKLVTTNTKAKIIKSEIEKIITIGKKDTLVARRSIIKKVGSNNIANKILKDISPRYRERNGGYTRITKIGTRKGDQALEVQLTLV